MSHLIFDKQHFLRSLLTMDIAVCLLVVNGQLNISTIHFNVKCERRNVSPKMPQAINIQKPVWALVVHLEKFNGKCMLPNASQTK